jgi:hypothetical protein
MRIYVMVSAPPCYYLKLTRRVRGDFGLDTIHPSNGGVLRGIRAGRNLHQMLTIIEIQQRAEEAGALLLFGFSDTDSKPTYPQAHIESELSKKGAAHYVWTAVGQPSFSSADLEAVLRYVAAQEIPYSLLITGFAH